MVILLRQPNAFSSSGNRNTNAVFNKGIDAYVRLMLLEGHVLGSAAIRSMR
jgi:hypothetical protein